MDIVAASHMGKILEHLRNNAQDAFSILFNSGERKWYAMILTAKDEKIFSTGATYMEAIANLDTLVRKD